MSDSTSILDSEMLSSLRELAFPEQSDFIKKLLTLFVQGAPERIRSIQKASQSGDLITVAREAHSLKSSAANIGAKIFSQICQQLDKAARSSDSSAVQTEVSKLQPALDAVLKEIALLPEMK